jgi:hypothetical protein
LGTTAWLFANAIHGADFLFMYAVDRINDRIEGLRPAETMIL